MTFQEQMLHKTDGIIGTPIPVVTADIQQKLSKRIANVRLFAHAYSFNLNFLQGDFTVFNLLDFAHEQKLQGIMINVIEGPRNSIGDMSGSELEEVRMYAVERSLQINLEVSATDKVTIDEGLRIAAALSVKNLRVYSRVGGVVSQVLQGVINDLKYAVETAEKDDVYIVLEQHEALTSLELVQVVEAVDSPRLQLMYDVGNMITANEHPLPALEVMSAHIRQVHIKDVRRVVEKHGSGVVGVASGSGEMPLMKVLFDILMLGNKESQVHSIGIQEVVGYDAPAFRFDNEGDDPHLPERGVSITSHNDMRDIEEVFITERRDAENQVVYIRGLFSELETLVTQELHLL